MDGFPPERIREELEGRLELDRKILRDVSSIRIDPCTSEETGLLDGLSTVNTSVRSLEG